MIFRDGDTFYVKYSWPDTARKAIALVEGKQGDIEINMELLKASITELPDDKRLEIYRWIYETFPKCRIYER